MKTELTSLAEFAKIFPDVSIMNVKVYTDYQEWKKDSEKYYTGEYKQIDENHGLGWRNLNNH